MHASTYRSAAALLFAAAVGCDAPALPTGPAAPPTATAPVEEEKPIVAGIPGEKLPEIETPVTSTPRPFNSHDPIKGRRSRDAGGYLGAAAGARFHAEYQMLINNAKHANQLYWAEHGDWPQSNEEFMEKIIEFNKLVLPELEPHHEYIYVPEQAEVGLQIRLKPGYNADGSKNADASAEEAAPADGTAPVDGAAPAETPAAESAAPAEAPAEAAPGEPEGGRDDAGNPLDLRERAAGFGGVSPTDGLSE
jgi:hypothetical protein